MWSYLEGEQELGCLRSLIGVDMENGEKKNFLFRARRRIQGVMFSAG